jgi:hypothetical protein
MFFLENFDFISPAERNIVENAFLPTWFLQEKKA